LADLADVFEQVGEVEEAEEVQAEAVKINVKDLEAYIKLGKIKEKLGKTGVKAYVNGVEPKFDVEPMIKGGRALVPFRAIAESLKAQVVWNAEDKSVIVIKQDIEVKLVIGSNTAFVNEQEVTLDVSAQIIGNRVVVPLRFLSESLKTVVKWEPTTKSIVVYEEASAEAAAEATAGASTETAAEATTEATTEATAEVTAETTIDASTETTTDTTTP
jgi:hypothetical protein